MEGPGLRHRPLCTDLVQRRRPQLPPASLCVGPQAVCAVCWGEWQTGWEGSLQRPTSDLRSKASSRVSGAVAAFPSPVPHRLSRRGGNREWSRATLGQQGRDSLCPRHVALCPLWTRVSSSQEFMSQVHGIRGTPIRPSFASLLLLLQPPTEMLVLEGGTGGTGGGGPAPGVRPRATWPGLWLLVHQESVRPTWSFCLS